MSRRPVGTSTKSSARDDHKKFVAAARRPSPLRDPSARQRQFGGGVVIVTVTGPVTKRCPYRDEPDEGTVEMQFRVLSGDAPELHGLADELASTSGEAISHEDYTRALYAAWFPRGLRSVRTTWNTAGLEVTVDVPDRSR